MVMTILEAKVAADREGALKAAFERAQRGGLPPFMKETFLLNEDGSDVWRIATVWNSREELGEYRRSVETPAGITMFQEAGATPTLSMNEIVVHSSH